MKYFGTDGFRGKAGVSLTAEHAYKIGRFIGWYFSKQRSDNARVVIGKDTRRSSYMLEYAIVAGLTASGADAYLLHVTTTPSVSYVAQHDDFDCGIMISASHNPFYDNGIKLINSDGEKADDGLLSKIESYLDGNFDCGGDDLPLATEDKIGKVVDYFSGRNRYIGYLISISTFSCKDIKIGLDCANGSAWMIAKSVFDALGAKTYVINAEPDGTNINKDAGSTHIERLADYVKREHLDIGFAFDGDADRCIAVDEFGQVVNGDQIMYILACEMKRRSVLPNNTVVTTVMSNMGLYRALDEAGIDHVSTQVGDRYVYENMRENGHGIGGEQSGHIIMSKYSTTGDGILTAIKLMEAVIETKLPLSKLASRVKMYPQVLKNVRVGDKSKVMLNEKVKNKLLEIRGEIGSSGRILLRESGTEPVIRVMAEAESEELCDKYVGELVSVIFDEGLALEGRSDK